jgi:DNA polymerase III delta prime subunit
MRAYYQKNKKKIRSRYKVLAMRPMRRIKIKEKNDLKKEANLIAENAIKDKDFV